MNTNTFSAKTFLPLLSLLLLSVPSFSRPQQDAPVMTREDGMYVIDTTTLGKQFQGYAGTTPLKVYIKKNRIVKIEALKNQETPKYFAKVKKLLLPKWEGIKVSEAQKLQVDAVTGATFSSNAVQSNVAAALDYYKSHK